MFNMFQRPKIERNWRLTIISGQTNLNGTKKIQENNRLWSDFLASAMSGRRGSNSRPPAWEASALPTELLPQRADRGTRTPDPRITNALLYQLSHIGKSFRGETRAAHFGGQRYI